MKTLSQEDFDDIRIQGNKVAMESLQDLYARMPFGQQTILTNGKTATIQPFYPPTTKHDGHLSGIPHFGVDMKFDDGAVHIEFIVYQSGWGGSVEEV